MEINPLEAKALREAYRNTKPEDELPEDMIRGDYVEIRARHCVGKHGRGLVIIKDGKVVASVEITNAILKRLKREWAYWNDIHGGSLSDHRAKHGGLGRGW